MGYSFKLKQGKVTGSFFFYDAVNPTASGDGTVDPPYECWTGRGPGDYDSDVHFVAKKR